jgi:hypothetical protein
LYQRRVGNWSNDGTGSLITNSANGGHTVMAELRTTFEVARPLVAMAGIHLADAARRHENAAAHVIGPEAVSLLSDRTATSVQNTPPRGTG